MSLFAIMMVSIGAFAGGLVNGLARFGTGLFALGWVNVLFLKMIVATLLVLFGLYFTIWRHIPKLRQCHLLGDISTVFAGGTLGAVAGLSGALPTMSPCMTGPTADSAPLSSPSIY